MLILTLLSGILGSAAAKDLRSHVGVGLHQDQGDLSQISVRFGLPTKAPTLNVQLELLGGFEIHEAGSTEGAYGGGGRVLFGVVAEDNMNLYVGLGAGYRGYMSGDAAVVLSPSLSAEAFLFGLENLGISGDLNVPFAIGLATTGTHFGVLPGAAVHYYF